MSRISDETIQLVRDRVDIVELIGRYVTLRQAGRNFKGLCPFHNEKTPSFNVNVDRQIFHCFGCGEGGNAITFLMRHDNLSFPEAVRQLADEYGIVIPEASNVEAGLVEPLFKLNRFAQDVYSKILRSPQGSVAREYLVQREIADETIDKFGLGFAPDSWDTLAKAIERAKFSVADAERAGLLARSEKGRVYDRLRGRITFPIQDVRGRVIGFGGRTLGKSDGAKYLNSPETPIYRKREAFYGFPHALEAIRRGERVVLVEGYFDLIAMHCAGVVEALATCGTALATEHAQDLRRRAKEVVLVFDGDEAGQRAMHKGLEVLLPQSLRVRAVLLPDALDPDDFRKKRGDAELRRLIEEAPMALDLVTRRALAQGCATPWQKADVAKQVTPLLALIPNSIERDEFMRRLALQLDTKQELLAAEVRTLRGADGDDVSSVTTARAPRQTASRAERYAQELVTYLVAQPAEARQLESVDLDLLLDDGPWKSILRAMECWQMEGEGSLLDMADRLDDAAKKIFREVVAHPSPLLDAERIAVAVHDVIERLQERRVQEERRAETRKFLEDPSHDVALLLEKKQKQLEEKRALLGLGGRSHRRNGETEQD